MFRLDAGARGGAADGRCAGSEGACRVVADGGRPCLFSVTLDPVLEYGRGGADTDADTDTAAEAGADTGTGTGTGTDGEELRVDDDGTWVGRRANEAFGDRFGIDGDIAGAPLSDVLVTGRAPDADGGDADPAAEEETLLDLVARGEEAAVERYCETVDGERPFLVRVVPVADGESESEGGYVVYTDVSDVSRLTAADGLSIAEVIAHDLRNPLDVANIRLELAEETGDDEHFEALAAAHERMRRIIEDSLRLASQGRVIEEPTETDVAATAREAWEMVATGGATLRVEDPGRVSADAGRLREVFENLFRNAVEHGGADVTVEVGGLPDGFYVADDGIGIPEDERETVFEAGYTTTDEGSGFGLAIVEAIVEAHGWEIRVEDGPEGGARFEITGVDAGE